MRFIKSISKTAVPLYSTTPPNGSFEWMTSMERAFTELKGKLVKPADWVYPNFDAPFAVVTDFSEPSIRDVISQKGKFKKLHSVLGAAKTRNDTERK